MVIGLRILISWFFYLPLLVFLFFSFQGLVHAWQVFYPWAAHIIRMCSSDIWHIASTINAITKHHCMTSLKTYWQVTLKAINTHTLDVMCSYYVRQSSSGSWSSDECRTHGRAVFLPEPSPARPLPHPVTKRKTRLAFPALSPQGR